RQTFTVVPTVTNDSGQTSSASRTVPVSASLPPTAAIFTFSPTNPAINQAVVFSAAVTPGVETFLWDFGDSTAPATGPTTTHRFTRGGTYSVMLRVSNSAGQSASSSRQIAASAHLPGRSVHVTFSPTMP